MNKIVRGFYSNRNETLFTVQLRSNYRTIFPLIRKGPQIRYGLGVFKYNISMVRGGADSDSENASVFCRGSLNNINLYEFQ